MKKSLFIFVLALLASTFLFPPVARGQNNYEDVVYLKNGGIIHGMIIEQVPNVSIKIQTADRNVFVYRIDEIEKITKEPVPASQGRPSGMQDTDTARIKTKGLIVITEMNLDRYDFRYRELTLSTGYTVIVGYLFNPNFSMGAGICLEKTPDDMYMPLFADLRLYMLKKPITPFISAGIGYSAYLGHEPQIYSGGLLAYSDLGLKFTFKHRIAFQFSMGFKYMEYAYEAVDYVYPGGYFENFMVRNAFKFLNANIGMTF
jgi:hypothetical protein